MIDHCIRNPKFCIIATTLVIGVCAIVVFCTWGIIGKFEKKNGRITAILEKI